MKPRPTKAKPGDNPLPTKMRAAQAGVLLIEPTLADRAKLALGYSIRVRVHQTFQHNPGKIEAKIDWECVPQIPTKDMPKIKRPGEEDGK